MEAKLRGITKVLPNLQIVHSDAQQLAEMITFTSTLAENVSAKVRQLDIARVRQVHVHHFVTGHIDTFVMQPTCVEKLCR